MHREPLRTSQIQMETTARYEMRHRSSNDRFRSHVELSRGHCINLGLLLRSVPNKVTNSFALFTYT